MIKLVLSLLLTFSATATKANSIYVGEDRIVPIVGLMTTQSMFMAAVKVQQLVKDQNKPIVLLIDSGGGEVDASRKFTQLIQLVQKSREVICIANGMAASMALYLYSACNNRYAYQQAKFMWHELAIIFPPAIRGIKLTYSFMKEKVKELEKDTKEYQSVVKSVLKVSDEFYRYHELRETFFTTQQMLKLNPDFAKILDILYTDLDEPFIKIVD